MKIIANWLLGLPSAVREDVHAAMREVSRLGLDEAEKAGRLAPGLGQTAVGGQDFDHHLRSEIAGSYLRSLRMGATPDRARSAALADMAQAVGVFNRRRPDIARSDTSETPFLDRCHALITRTVAAHDTAEAA